jgi:hypothetical protein
MLSLPEFKTIPIMKYKLTFLCLFICFSLSTKAQLNIALKIDTGNAKIAGLYHFINNYLLVPEDSVRKQYWNPKYKNFTDYYNYSNFIDWIWRGYKPSYLNREFHIKLTELDTINDTLSYFKIMFYSKDLIDTLKCAGVYKYYITARNGNYYLDNCKDYETRDFYSFKTKNIHFFVSPFIKADTVEMLQSSRKVDSLCNRLSRNSPANPFSYYMCSNQNELLIISNIVSGEQYVGGYTNMEARYIVSITNKPFYPHEFIHVILGKGASFFITGEGIASLYGGLSKQTTYCQGVQELQECYHSGRCNFDNLFGRKVYNLRNNNPTYAFAAVFCQYIINTAGISAFYTLYYDKEITDANFMDKVSRLIHKNKEEIRKGVEKLLFL